MDGYIGIKTVQCSLQRLTLMEHGNTIPLYTSVEGKRDYVVSTGIKNWWIVGNHCFSLCLVPIIQTFSFKKQYFSMMEPNNLKESGGLTPCSKPLFKSEYSLSYSRKYSHSEVEGSFSLHYSLPRVPPLTSTTFMQSAPFHPLFLLEQM